MPSPTLFSLNSIPEGMLSVSTWETGDDVASTEKCERLGALLPRAMTTLNDREQEVIRRRYGFSGEHTQSYGQIGQSLGISRERVRQILRRAEGKIERSLSLLTAGDE